MFSVPLVRQTKPDCSIQLKGIEQGKCSFAMKRDGRRVRVIGSSKPHLAKMSAAMQGPIWPSVNPIRPRYAKFEVASFPEVVKPTRDVKQRAFAASRPRRVVGGSGHRQNRQEPERPGWVSQPLRKSDAQHPVGIHNHLVTESGIGEAHSSVDSW